MVCCMRACRRWVFVYNMCVRLRVFACCVSVPLRVCFDQPLRWRPVTKVVDDICNNTVELYVAGFHGEIKCCTTVTQSRSRIMTLWIRNYLEDLGPEFTAGMRLFLCVLKAAKLTYRRSRELDDNLKGVHWMVIGIARLQHAGWRDCSPVYSSDVVHDLLRFAADCDFDEVAVDVGKGGISPKRSPAYKKFSNHAIVVMYDGRNLTSRCTPAKLQRIQGRLRQIVEFFERDPRQFWSQQQDIWPQIEMPEESDFAFPNTLRAVCTLTMPSGRDMFSAQPQAGPARGGPPLPKQQPAAPVQAHFPPHIQVPTAPQVRFKQPPPQAPRMGAGSRAATWAFSHHRQLRFCSRRRMDHGCINCGSSRRLLGFQNSRHRRRRTCNCRGSLRDHHRLFQLGQICPLAQGSVT